MNPNFEITGTELLMGVGIGVIVLLALIFVFRTYFRRRSERELAKEYEDKKSASPLEARNKYPEVDVFRYTATFWRFSLAAVLLLIIAAFNWTVYEKEVFIPDDALAFDSDIEVEVPRSAAPPPPPPPPPPPEPEVEEIFKIVEEMPRFPGCEEMSASIDEKRACANRKLLEFIYENIRYPAVARDNGIEGTVVVSFVVSEKGTISRAEVLRDIGGGCGAEALRIVNMMNDLPEKWTPGKQRGRPVKVLFNLPIKFKLEYN